MKIRALDKNGDMVWGTGKQAYLTGLPCVKQDCKTALQMILGECFWKTTFGVDWYNLLGKIGADKIQEQIVLQTRTMILSRPGVYSITKTDVTRLPGRRLSIAYNITTLYGEIQDTILV